MKTMTVTYHAANNCGSFLQAFALQQTLIGRFGVENTIVDFRSKELIQNYKLFRPLTSLKNAFKNLYSLIHYRDLKLRAVRYEDARMRYLYLTDTIYDIRELALLEKSAKLFIVGSDQIWNTTAPDFSEAFFLPGFANKCAYGVSLGPDCAKAPLSAYAKSIREFREISLREIQGSAEVSKYYQKPVSVVLDPTLLLSRDQYNIFVSDKSGKPDSTRNSNDELLSDEELYEGEYIFYYSMKYTTSGLRQAVALSRETGLPVITVFTNYHTSCVPHGIKIKYDAGPKEFLHLLSRAKIVVTDSYHGIIFSIIYHKPLVYARNEQERDDRIENLFKCLHIPMGTVSVEAVLNGRQIDWTLAESHMELLRSHSLDFIKQILDTT
ncbi:MAG: polysaccharide pyruvyl transferase family protein [Lachnospiraceae bacterium]